MCVCVDVGDVNVCVCMSVMYEYVVCVRVSGCDVCGICVCVGVINVVCVMI